MNDTSEVKLHFLDYWRVIRIRWSIIVISFLLVMVTAGVTCFFLPRQYFSAVTMEVKPDDTTLDIFGGGRAFQTDWKPNLAPTQLQVLQSKGIIYPVIDSLKLVEAWADREGAGISKERVYEMLLRQMTVVPVRNTDMIRVGVYSVDRQEAAQIANMIAAVYSEVRKNDQMQVRQGALSRLKDEVGNQQKTVEAAQAEMERIRKRDGIYDPNPDSMDNRDLQVGVFTDEQKQFNDTKSKVTELRTQLKQVEGLTGDDLMKSLTTLNIPDPTIAKILPLFQDANSEEARLLNSGLGENHPKVKSLRAQKEVFSKQLSEAIAAVRTSLAIRLKVAEETLGALQAKMDSTSRELDAKTSRNQEYINVKQNYINAKKVQEAAEARLSTQTLQLQIGVIPAKIWDKAEPSLFPSWPPISTIMFASIAIGLLVGVALAFFIEYLDTSVKTLDDVERYLKAPVLAVIPKGIATLFKHQGDSPDAEAYRILRTNIEFNNRKPNARTMTLVSGGPGEGKSTTLNNLAVTCANGGYNVLVVDADLRRPSQHTFFDADNEVGLSDVLLGTRTLEECIVKTSLANLSFLPSGNLPDDAVGILNSQSMIDLVDAVRGRYDLIFFDSPPILGVSDASILASEVDMAIMVVQYRRFPRAMLERVKGAVENVGGHLLGIVLNNVDTKHDSGYQYYTQYYDYYTPDAERKKRKSIKQIPAGAAIPEKVTFKPGDY